MRTIKTIVPFLFLAIMLFTVFQYIPLTEEEDAGHLTELSKKAKESDGPADDDSGDADDSGDDNDLHTPVSYNWYAHAGSRLLFHQHHILYPRQVRNIITPPPRV